MAGITVAPKDTSSTPTIVGVAWGSDAHSITIDSDVVGGGAEHMNVDDAAAALWQLMSPASNPHGARIVSMAFGYPFPSSLLADAIREADKSGLLLVVAAGTHISNVSFPGTMEEVTTVSLVDAAATSVPIEYAAYPIQKVGGVRSPYATVAYGPSVDFVIPTKDGVWAPTTGETADQISSIGGSSSGVAHLSGMMALAWSERPEKRNWQIQFEMRKSASLAKVKNAYSEWYTVDALGAGIPDAYVASGGSTSLGVVASSAIASGQTYTLEARGNGYLPLQYRFDAESGFSSSKFRTYTGGPTGSYRTHTVTAYNPRDGRTLNASHTVYFATPTHSAVYATQEVRHYPSWGVGGRVDYNINENVQLPVGCTVSYVLGYGIDAQGQIETAGYGDVDFSNRGWIVRKLPGAPANDLGVYIHGWHDGTSALRMRVGYVLNHPTGIDCTAGLVSNIHY